MSAAAKPIAVPLQLEVPVTNYTLALQFLKTKVFSRLQNELTETEFVVVKRFILENAMTNNTVFGLTAEQLKQAWADLVGKPSAYRLVMSLTNDLALFLGESRLSDLVRELRVAYLATFRADIDNTVNADYVDAFERSILDARSLSVFSAITDGAQRIDLSKHLWVATLHLLSSFDNLGEIAALQPISTNGQ